MIKHNELVIDGVRTSSFPFKVIVHDSPSIALGESKTALWSMVVSVEQSFRRTNIGNWSRKPIRFTWSNLLKNR